jgi:hypothetical protein
MRPQIPRLRIDCLIFLFNPDGESRFHVVNKLLVTPSAARNPGFAGNENLNSISIL